jgi:hypothetical protein
MPPLPVPHEEALARALAMGRSRNAAGTDAGYGRRHKNRARSARPEIVARAREIGDTLQWGEACEADEMIRVLMRLAGKAGGMRTAAAMVAARGLVAEAAKLDARRETPPAATPIDPCFLPLSDEDWAAKYGNRG